MAQTIFNRAWFKYNTAATGYYPQYDSTNYAYSKFFPSCLATGYQICSVYGLYNHDWYGNHPTPFTIDTDLEYYISDALAAGSAKPSALGAKRYVYVRTV